MVAMPLPYKALVQIELRGALLFSDEDAQFRSICPMSPL